MKNKVSLKFRWADLAVVSVALLIATAVFFLSLPKTSSARLFAEIKLNGELLASLPLDTDTDYTVSGDYLNIIRIRDGAAFFLSSDCPNNDCVRLGKLNATGELAVCLPNGVTVEIVGGSTSVDAIAG